MKTFLCSLLWVVVLAIGIPQTGTAACPNYSENLHWLSSATVQGHVNAAVFSEGRLYVVTGCPWTETCTGQLAIYDLADPRFPTLVGTLSLLGSGRDLVVSGDIAYIAEGKSGLVTVDISEPSVPMLLAEWKAADGHHVEIVGNLAYLLTPSSLVLLDVTDPSVPTEVGSIDYGGTGMAVAGSHVYILPGLTVIDVSVPTSPLLVQEGILYDHHGFPPPYPEPGDPEHEGQARIVDNLLYTYYCYPTPFGAADNDIPASGDPSGFLFKAATATTLDLSDPAAPTILRTRESAGGPTGVRFAVGGEFLFSNYQPGSFDTGVTSLRIGSSSFEYTGWWNVSASELRMHDDELWVFARDEVHRFYPGPLGGEELLGRDFNGAKSDILIQGNYIYGSNQAGSGGSKFMVFDVTVPTEPTYMGGFFGQANRQLCKLGILSEDVVIRATYDLIAARSRDEELGIQSISYVEIIDVSTPSAPLLMRTVTLPDVQLSDLALEGNYGYFPASAPVKISEARIEIIDFTLPNSPVHLPPVPMIHEVGSAAIYDGRLIATGGNNASVLSLDNPPTPSTLSTTDLSPYRPQSITVTPDALYIVASKPSEGFHLLTLELVGGTTLELRHEQRILRSGDIQVAGEILTVGGGDYFDIRVPLAPEPIAGFRGQPIDCYLIGDGRLYTSVNRFSPSNPQIWLNVFDLPCFDPTSVPTPPVSTSPQVSVWPNPAAANQRILFRLPEGIVPDAESFIGELSTVRVFDTKGRLLRSIPVAETIGSVIAVDWNGRNESGETVPSGVYVTRLEYEGRILESTVVRIR